MLHKVAFLVLAVGGLNWLLVGVLGWDIGNLFGGMDALVSRIIYILVGLAALYELFTHKSNCRACMAGKADKGMEDHGGASEGGGM